MSIMTMPARMLISSALVASLTACGDGSNDSGTGGSGGDGTSTTSTTSTGGSRGTGGSGTGGSPSVLGTRFSGGACAIEEGEAFIAACEAEGGKIDDGCYASVCAHPADHATCYAPFEPAADEFSCDGVFACKVGTVCMVVYPQGDGCTSHECVTPVACAADLTCACIEAQSPPASCIADSAGNVTVTYNGFAEGF